MSTMQVVERRGWWSRSWPWLTLIAMTLAGFWYVFDFESDIDQEFPKVDRPTFSARPAPAYRLAEAGDTIDRVGIYIASLAIVLSLRGLASDPEHRRRWFVALALSAAGFWQSANPGPTYDGWHGLGWRVIADASAPTALRCALIVAALGIAGVVAWGLSPRPGSGTLRALWAEAKAHRVKALLILAACLVILRPFDLPGVEPAGFWPRWAFMLGLIAFAAALVRLQPSASEHRALRLLRGSVMAATWFACVWSGIWLTWYHRPLDRLREVVPGRIFISAMPTTRGLDIAQQRHHFKTIINLFPEDSPLQSPLYPRERRWAEAHGVKYVLSPADIQKSDWFLDETLRIAQDPASWPILVHCHACMDRTPAWVGIYRFVVENQPLDAVMKFIERHRGYRPKASVTLLYNRVLPRLAPESCRNDPTFARLQRAAAGTIDPYFFELEDARKKANPSATAGVSEGSNPAVSSTLPNLTPRR